MYDAERRLDCSGSQSTGAGEGVGEGGGIASVRMRERACQGVGGGVGARSDVARAGGGRRRKTGVRGRRVAGEGMHGGDGGGGGLSMEM